MCMSPNELTSARLEEMVDYYRDLANEYSVGEHLHGYFHTKADNLNSILKERAEDGTYDTAGV